MIPDRSPTLLDFGPHKGLIKRELPMLRIEKESNGHTTTPRLRGRIQSANIGNIRAQIDDDSVRIFMHLDEVTLVDVEVVRFLSECEVPTLCSRVDSSRASRRGTAASSEWCVIREGDTYFARVERSLLSILSPHEIGRAHV